MAGYMVWISAHFQMVTQSSQPQFFKHLSLQRQTIYIMTFKTFYFEIIVGSHVVLGSDATEIPYTLHQVSPSSNIVYHCSSIL